mgnify:FL=1|tara:strand:- start:319 stop:702 length:384 start_codon:yes stop_codon:yes gene_type:complete
MANTDNIISFVAAEAITEFALVSVDTAGKIVITDAATDRRCVGVAQRACALGDSVEVKVNGITRVVAGATIANTVSLIMADTDGKVVTHATSGNFSIGQVLPNINQVSSAAGDQIFINFTGPQNLVP